MRNVSTSPLIMLSLRSLFIGLIVFGPMVFTAIGQECGIIYIAPGGASAGATGTRVNPANLSYGLSLSNATNNVVWLAAGVYTINNELAIPNNVTIEGGFDPTTWIKSNNTPSVINRTALNPLPSPANALVGLTGLNASGFRLQDLTISVADAPPGGISVYGVYLALCSNYDIVRCEITTGAGGAGLPGSPGSIGLSGGNGSPGLNGYQNETLLPGGAGGVGGGGNNGGNGANGGKHASFGPGSPGLPANCGGTGGNTPDGPECSAGCFFGDPSCGGVGPGTPGQPGGTGGPGAAGAIGPQGTYNTGYFVPGTPGGNGTDGTPGCGGGGGGGGAGRQRDGTDDTGGSGGGGGGGGYGGTGGTGGLGGGGSFAMFTWNNGTGGNVVDCNLNAGAGGTGGIGGSGGVGGPGGIGGVGGGPGPCGGSSGAPGGPGGPGGIGGLGGSGATGPSIDLDEQGGGTAVVASGINGVPGNPPVISVDNYGCTNSDIIFSSPGSGTWDFGAGANPATANGSGPFAISYPTTGRRTITFSGIVFTDFVGIFNDGPVLPTITPANGTVDAGCPNQYTTTLVGSQYDWDFGPVATPATESGASLTTTSDVIFSTPGTYWVKVTVLTACCGPVTDSTQVTVQANNFDVTLTASSTSICEGDPIIFTATPASYDNYEFFVDGVSVQNGPLAVYTSSTIQQGDSIYVEAFVGNCFANPSDTIIPTVNPIPTVTLTSDDVDNEICDGETITFTADPPGMDNYEFFNGGTSLQSGTSEILFGTVPINNSITVVATNDGCPSVASAPIVTLVNPVPTVTLTSSELDNSICEGDLIIFTALPLGLSEYEFFEGAAFVQAGALNIYQTSTLVNGTDVTVIGTSSAGCVSVQTIPINTAVNPYPSVTLSSSDPDDEICQGESITFTAALAGFDNYEFFDGATSVQNSASEIWTTTGLIAGNSITVEATNNGCTSVASAAIVTDIIIAPTVDPGSDLDLCIDSPDEILAGFSPPGGTWTGTGITNPTGVFSAAATGLGTFTVSYAVSNANCTTTETIDILVHDLPIVVAGTYGPICEGESVNLNASGAASYVWDPPTGLSNASIADPIASPLVTTTYTVGGIDLFGCTSSDQTTLTIEPVPSAAFTGNTVCLGDSLTFENLSNPEFGLTFVWNFGDGQTSTDSIPAVLYQAEGTFSVTMVATLGNCSDNASGTVTVNPIPTAGFSLDPTYTSALEPLIHFEDLSENAVSWSWDYGDGSPSVDEQNPSYFFSDTGMQVITLTVFNSFGCADSVADSVFIAPFTTLYVPSAFTPDQDRINDVFYAYGEDINNIDFRVFDRWGKVLFYTNNITVGWDGRDRLTGKEVKSGLYTYQVLYEDFRGRGLKKLGRVSLIR